MILLVLLKSPVAILLKPTKLIGKTRPFIWILVGLYNDKYFINIAAAGSLTELTYSVPSQLKTMFGYLAYE